MASLAYSFLISLLLHFSLLPPVPAHHHHHHLLPACKATTALLLLLHYLPSVLVVCFFQLHLSTIALLPDFCLSLCLPSILFFPFPRFFAYASPWSRARRAEEPGPNLPPSLGLPVYACLCLGLWRRPAPYRPPSSAHLLYLSAGSLPSTHTHTQLPFIYPERLVEEEEEKKR